MQHTELKATVSLALLMTFRLLGLFMILPIFTPYALTLQHTTPHSIGLALGIYGLTQACLQIPFGLLSDKFGRKRIIFLGFVIFAVGSVVAALAHSIEGVIVGRALQGGGAVGSAIIALIADSTRDEQRTKAMAILGMTIGFAFAIALVLGPLLNNLIGVRGIFWLTAGLAGTGILILFFVVPTPQKSGFHRDAEPVPALFKTILTNKELLRLDIGILLQHAILTATFIVIPMAMLQFAHINTAHQWLIYLPVLLIAYVLMVPLIIIAEKKQQMKPIFLFSILLIAISQISLTFFHSNLISFVIALLIFFTAFTVLEAMLPSLVSKIAPAGSKGTATGIYSTSQFFGIFVGGTLGGWLYAQFGMQGIFVSCSLVTLAWFVIAVGMSKPPTISTKIFALQHFKQRVPNSLKQQLIIFPGIRDVYLDAETVYLKVDSGKFDEKQFSSLLEEC